MVRKQTKIGAVGLSVKCHKRTFATTIAMSDPGNFCVDLRNNFLTQPLSRQHPNWSAASRVNLDSVAHVVCLDQPEATIMTHQNELNTNRRSRIIDDTRYTHWIIGGVVTLAIVIAAAAFTSTGNNLDEPQTITTVPAPASSPSTTGSDTAPPAPANR